MPTKLESSVDEIGLRTHCSDGHRLYWPDDLRERRAQRVLGDRPHDAFEEARGAICSKGHFWKQHRTPLRDSWSSARRGRTPTGAPPKLERTGSYNLSGGGGAAKFTITLDGAGNRVTQAILHCSNYHFSDPALEYTEDRERYQHETLLRWDESSTITSENQWLGLIKNALAGGWDVTGNVKCPVCKQAIADFNAWRERQRQKAVALEQQETQANT